MDIVFLSLEQSIITYVSINRDTILLSRAMHLRIILATVFYICLRFISNWESVAGSVIQATGTVDFEDGLWTVAHPGGCWDP